MYFVMRDDLPGEKATNVRLGGYISRERAEASARRFNNAHILNEHRLIVGVVKNKELMSWG